MLFIYEERMIDMCTAGINQVIYSTGKGVSKQSEITPCYYYFIYILERQEYCKW